MLRGRIYEAFERVRWDFGGGFVGKSGFLESFGAADLFREWRR